MAKKKRDPVDRAIVVRFVAHLMDNGYPDLKVDHWLEDEHPGQSVVEAIAGPFAIEHTSVDTLPEQRTVGAYFQKALGYLEYLPVSSRLTINVPYELVKVGRDWNSYFLALAEWALLTSPSLDDGPHEISMPGIELKCTAMKDSGRPTGIILYRSAPDDDTLPERVRTLIDEKMKKLGLCKNDGHTTLLIIESRDNALMNQYKMLEAVRTAIKGQLPHGLDQIWYAEAGGHVFFDFTGPISRGDDTIE